MFTIMDGTGRGYLTKVSKFNQLVVRSESEPIQHTQGLKGDSYQLVVKHELSVGENVLLNMKNVSTNKNLVVTYLRHQVVEASGGSSFPNRSNYFSFGLGQEYYSGGESKDPVNINTAVGALAVVEARIDNPSLTGTYKEIDPWYTKALGDMNAFNKEGSVIVTPNKSLQLKYFTDHTSGFISVRISFIMKEIED